MKWMIDNWFLIVILGVMFCFVGASILSFSKLTKEEKLHSVKEWLKFAVCEAEKELGSGTGQLKLRWVYGEAIKQFPFLINMISFEMFAEWVDEALAWMERQLISNKSVRDHVQGE